MMVTTHVVCWRPRMKNGEEKAANRRGEWATDRGTLSMLYKGQPTQKMYTYEAVYKGRFLGAPWAKMNGVPYETWSVTH